MTLADFLYQVRGSRPGPSSIRFGAPDPFKRVRKSGTRNFKRSKPQALPKTRQCARRFLFIRALFELNRRESKEAIRDGKRCWFNIMPRAERRNLARAYAAGEWRRGNPARGIKKAA